MMITPMVLLALVLHHFDKASNLFILYFGAQQKNVRCNDLLYILFVSPYYC